MTTNERMNSIKQTAVIEGDKHMNTHRQTATIEGGKRMNTHRQAAIIVGVLFLLTEVTSLLGLFLYTPILNGPAYLVNGFANKDQVILGAVMELLLVCANIGTAVGLFPFLRKSNEGIALGYVCFRVLEAVFIMIGIVAILSLLTVSQSYVEAAAPNASAFQVSGTLLLAVHNWTFQLGPNFMLGINTMMCSYLLYRSRIVPQFIAILGLAGSALIVLAALLEMFGVVLQLSTLGVLLGMPILAYEVSLGIWLIVKGFNPSASAFKPAKTETNELLSAV